MPKVRDAFGELRVWEPEKAFTFVDEREKPKQL